MHAFFYLISNQPVDNFSSFEYFYKYISLRVPKIQINDFKKNTKIHCFLQNLKKTPEIHTPRLEYHLNKNFFIIINKKYFIYLYVYLF